MKGETLPTLVEDRKFVTPESTRQPFSFTAGKSRGAAIATRKMASHLHQNGNGDALRIGSNLRRNFAAEGHGP